MTSLSSLKSPDNFSEEGSEECSNLEDVKISEYLDQIHNLREQMSKLKQQQEFFTFQGTQSTTNLQNMSSLANSGSNRNGLVSPHSMAPSVCSP